MIKPHTKMELDVLEGRGHWEASSSLHGIIKRLVRKDLPLEIGHIKHAHKIIFEHANQSNIAGKYRRDNGPELKRINGTILPIADWRLIPNLMAELDMELREKTKNLKCPKTEKDYAEIIFIAVRLSHRLAYIHPFKNGNGRASRLLLNAMLLRAGLPEIAIKKSKPFYLRAMCQADYGDFSILEKIVSDGLIEAQERTYETLIKNKLKSCRRLK